MDKPEMIRWLVGEEELILQDSDDEEELARRRREKSPGCYYKEIRRGHVIRSQTQQIILNVYSRIREELPTVPVEECVEETSRLTGVPSTAIFTAKKEWHVYGGVLDIPPKKRPRKSGPQKTDVKGDSFSLCTIRSIVHKYFFQNEPATVKKILSDVNSHPDLPCVSQTTLYHILNDLGFAYHQGQKDSSLTDKAKIIARRHRYLRKIRRCRSAGSKIFFLDETWVSAGHTVSKCGQDQPAKRAKDAFLKGVNTGLKEPSGEGSRLICAHCGNQEGFVEGALLLFESKPTGDDLEEMNGDSFEKWFGDLLTKLPPESVIVMDNASYHLVRSEKIPTAKSTKESIRNWLTENGISWEQDQVKPELLILVQREKHRFIQYRTDEMAVAAGHKVLRLPPYHAELNPIELAWSYIKGQVAEKNTTFRLDDVRNLFEEGVRLVTPEMWSGFMEQVIEKEQQFWDLDFLQEENETTSLKIPVGSDSDSDSSYTEEVLV